MQTALLPRAAAAAAAGHHHTFTPPTCTFHTCTPHTPTPHIFTPPRTPQASLLPRAAALSPAAQTRLPPHLPSHLLHLLSPITSLGLVTSLHNTAHRSAPRLLYCFAPPRLLRSLNPSRPVPSDVGGASWPALAAAVALRLADSFQASYSLRATLTYSTEIIFTLTYSAFVLFYYRTTLLFYYSTIL